MLHASSQQRLAHTNPDRGLHSGEQQSQTLLGPLGHCLMTGSNSTCLELRPGQRQYISLPELPSSLSLLQFHHITSQVKLALLEPPCSWLV